ncbi:MAG: substrate-binding domain-containing protein [Acidimicrobiia bacterium]|nr:substrate-binding domain-containing protein [Acidimicrobiia bacterium]MYB75229.1 substrate-binding domain-containing protein [Acidimicrobiia bacterium]MYI00719.1 substrate-binding domain-containing protein [Acidimicrobiia bacterium]
MRVRLQDVADRAEVSTATASLVLNGKDDSISGETRTRVRAAARDLGYRPNVLARSLRSQRTRTIGFISDEVATTPYAGAMIQGAQSVADEHGYVLLLANTDYHPNVEQRTVEALLDRQIDAAIYAIMYHRIVEPPTALGAIPTVILDSRPKDEAAFSWVAPDEIGGATAAVEHLAKAGHRRIAMINDQVGPPAAVEREIAWRTVLEARGLDRHPDLLTYAATDSASGAQAATRLLEGENPPSAVFCFNDRIAAGVYIAATRLGLTIPRDLSVVGYDNQVLVAEAVDPGLTSVQLPHDEMGRWAMEQVLSLLDKGAGLQYKRMPCPLVERGSVAPPGQL